MKRICKQCGSEFEITNSEISFYKKKKLSLPKRCKQCRDKNKQCRTQGDVNYSHETNRDIPIYNNVTYSKSRNNTHRWISYTIIVVMLLLTLLAVVFGVTRLIKNSETNTAVTYENKQYSNIHYTFGSENLLQEHYQKHGLSMGFDNSEEYLAAANSVVNNPKALHKTEKEDGDDVYYLESSNEFVIVSTDGYIRTYFSPDDGIEYYNRQ